MVHTTCENALHSTSRALTNDSSPAPVLLSFFSLLSRPASFFLSLSSSLTHAASLPSSLSFYLSPSIAIALSLYFTLSLPSQIKIRGVVRLKHVGGNLVVNDRRQCIKWLLFSSKEIFFSLGILSCDAIRLYFGWCLQSFAHTLTDKSFHFYLYGLFDSMGGHC